MNWNLRSQSSSILPWQLYHQLFPRRNYISIRSAFSYIWNFCLYSQCCFFLVPFSLILSEFYSSLKTNIIPSLFCETIFDHFASLKSLNLQISLALLIFFWCMNTLSLDFRTISFTPSPTSRLLCKRTQLSHLKYSTIHFSPLLLRSTMSLFRHSYFSFWVFFYINILISSSSGALFLLAFIHWPKRFSSFLTKIRIKMGKGGSLQVQLLIIQEKQEQPKSSGHIGHLLGIS